MPKAATTRNKSAALTRRTFMQTSAAVSSTVLMVPTGQAAGTSLEGYTAAPSTPQGGTMDFFLRDPQAVGSGTTVYPMSFTRVGQPDAYMGGAQVAIGNQAVPADAATQRLPLGAQLPPDGAVDLAERPVLRLHRQRRQRLHGAVRRARSQRHRRRQDPRLHPGVDGPRLQRLRRQEHLRLQLQGGVRASQVSLDRPFTESFNSFFDVWSQYLVRWLAKNSLAADFCTDVDIEAGGVAVLAPYQLYVQAGHDEYWSKGRRDTMEAFTARGGNSAYLGGNTAWFQSRLTAGNGIANRTLVCYKDAAADPVADPLLKTVTAITLVPPRPENIMTGSGFVTGCSWTNANIPRPNTPSITLRPEHWAFEGTGLAQGNGFGGAYVGYECNSAVFVKGSDQRSYATGSDGTPSSLRILAQADGSNWNDLSLAAGGPGEQSGYAHVSVFSNGGSAGTVFATGSSDWAYGLMPELNGQTATPISRITLNAINKLRQAWTESADVRQYRNAVGGVANYFYTTGTSAPAGSALVLDGWVFRAFPQPVNGSVPIYMKRSNASNVAQRAYYLQTVSTVGANETLVGVAFHAYLTARTGATAIYEHYAFNGSLQLWVAFYSPLATPPAGYTAGPVKFYAPLDTVASTPVVNVPSFTLTAAPTALTVVQGQTGSSSITVNPVNGFTGSVAFSTSGLPANVSASFTSASSTAGTVVRLVPSAGAAPGSYQVTVTGTSGSVSGSVVLTLVVAAAPSFTLALDDSSLTLPLGGLLGLISASARATVLGANGFNSPVTFSVSGVPAGLSVSLATPVSASGTNITVSRLLFPVCPLGNYPITLTGTAGSLSASVKLTVEVSLLF